MQYTFHPLHNFRLLAEGCSGHRLHIDVKLSSSPSQLSCACRGLLWASSPYRCKTVIDPFTTSACRGPLWTSSPYRCKTDIDLFKMSQRACSVGQGCRKFEKLRSWEVGGVEKFPSDGIGCRLFKMPQHAYSVEQSVC